ncbi:DNA-binding HxlR family transcriptional regulator [Halorubrum alkaliphilum]|uniref:DNA-binding HxlR family transcriptional regulator n=1 Tax=Halorubrum alkaliphilum TaxID=261290 RepID=A0A8T4GJ81_9EURY|nr:hypothetical protein [Halorubrum alkaliphilum]MBP1923650.1 DNA-binding HxlR family transcriptional regulator [Halorubrum alkaliphilum]
MVRTLVTDAELLWVLESFGRERRATASALAELLPLAPTSVGVRLRSLERRGYATRSASRGPVAARWSVTERGRGLVAEAGLPPVAETDLDARFAGREATIDPRTVLAAVAELGGAEAELGGASAERGGWVRSSAVYAALPYSAGAIRRRLLALRAAGLVERDAEGRTHRWRVTDAGRVRRASAGVASARLAGVGAAGTGVAREARAGSLGSFGRDLGTPGRDPSVEDDGVGSRGGKAV